MHNESNTARPQVLSPAMLVRRPAAGWAAIQPAVRAGAVRQLVATGSQRWRRRIELGAAAAAFLAALATTLYVALVESEGVTLRPVQLVPLALLPFALTAPRTFAVSRQQPLRFLALLWAAYMTSRFLLLAPTDPLTAVRSLTCVATFLSIIEFSVRQKRPRAALIGLVAGCLASVAVAAADISLLGKTPRYYGSSRWTGLMPDPNRFADLCGIAFVICFAMVIQRTATSTRYAWALCLAVCGGGLLASGSRGGLLATAFASLATIWLNGKAENRRLRMSNYLKPIAWLCVVTGAAVVVFGDHVSDRVWEFVTFSSAGRADVEDDPRGELAVAALEKFRKSPMIGGGAEDLLLDDREQSSHNSYLYLLSTSGLISFVLCSALLIVIMRPLWRIARHRSLPAEIKVLTTPALGGLIFLLVHMCVIDLVLSAHVWAFLGFAAAVSARCSAMSIFAAPQQRMKLCV